MAAVVKPVSIARLFGIGDGDLPSLFKTDEDLRINHILTVHQEDGVHRIHALRMLEQTEMADFSACGYRYTPNHDGRQGVLVVSTSTATAGCHRAWVELAPYLVRSEEYRFVFLLGRPGTFSERLAQLGAAVITGRSGLSPEDPHDAKLVSLLVHSSDFEIVHFDGGESGAWAWSAKAAGKHVVQHVRVLEPTGYRSSVAAADLVLAVSEPVLAAVRTLSGANSRTELLPDGIDLAHWTTPVGSPQTVLDSRSHADARKILLYPARISRPKRQRLALDVLLLLAGEGHEYRMILCGDPDEDVSYYDELKDYAATNSDLLTDRLTWLPFQNDMRPLYRVAHCVLALSESDALGMSILEALAMQKCVVAIDSGGVGDFRAVGGCLHLAGRGAGADEIGQLIVSLGTHQCKSSSAEGKLADWCADRRARTLFQLYSRSTNIRRSYS
jgi:glycosyltransferase involved in cell wall biosynthesis